MADVKISGLPASTTPLAGTEVLPIVQGGQTRQVSVNNLTTGKAVSATQYTSTIATGTAPLVVASTTEVANLKAANATSADTANQVKSNATTGVLQIAGPTAATTRVMTTPDANFTAARTDAAQSFTGRNSFLQSSADSFSSSVSIVGVNTGDVLRIIMDSAGAYGTVVAGRDSGTPNSTAGYLAVETRQSGGGVGEVMRCFSTGGVSIGNTTDPGATNLSVTGVIKIGANQAVNGPAFSAGLAPNNQSVTNSVWTKITIDTEDFDTNSNYDPTTNYRFTPTVGGYYQISAGITSNAAASGQIQCAIYKNGTLYKAGSQVLLGAATATTVTVSCLVDMNGSSDYVELYCFQGSAAALLVFTNSTASTWFQGSMVRGL